MKSENMQIEPSFYMAVILYEAQSDAPDYEPLYEESFVLISANSEEEAGEKAKIHTQQQLTRYQNEFGETITWVVKQIVDVSPVLTDTIEDGSELYTRHFRNYQAYSAFEPMLSGDD
ncbi:MAG: DUF4288 domain-containing protein [Ktedonobacteraceae bacterium]